jgi:outer membrane protein assembly factor BamD (BamD/ComL family)
MKANSFMFVIIFSFIFQTVSSWASTSDSVLNSLRRSFGLSVQKPQCKEVPEVLPEASDKVLFEAGEYHFFQGNYCEAARAYYELTRQNPLSLLSKKAWLNMAKAYLKTGEDILALNEALRLAFEHRATATGEEAHVMALMIVHRNSEKEIYETKKKWTEFSLGVNSLQTKENPYFQNMIYAEFSRIYPQSTANELIQSYYVKARNTYAAEILKQGQLFEMKQNLMSAFDKYTLLLKWGPNTPVFAESLYCMVRLQLSIADAVRNPLRFSDEQIISLSSQKVDLADKTRVLKIRQQVAHETIKEARSVFQQMLSKLPQDEWTQKARLDFSKQLRH